MTDRTVVNSKNIQELEKKINTESFQISNQAYYIFPWTFKIMDTHLPNAYRLQLCPGVPYRSTARYTVRPLAHRYSRHEGWIIWPHRLWSNMFYRLLADRGSRFSLFPLSLLFTRTYTLCSARRHVLVLFTASCSGRACCPCLSLAGKNSRKLL